MAPLIALALQIAPSLLKVLGANEPTQKLADKVTEVAEFVTGYKNPQQIMEILQHNSQAATNFRMELLNQETELIKLQYSDLASARARDVEVVKTTGANTRANWMFVLAVAVVVLLTFMVWSIPEINEYVKGVMTLILGRFLGYLDTIYNFEFGYTRGKQKADNTISALSKINGEK